MLKNPHLPGTPDEYIATNMGLAHKIAWNFYSASLHDMTNTFDQDEYNSIAYEGLIKAYTRFDPTFFKGIDGNIKFGTYAYSMVKGEIMRAQRNHAYTIRRKRGDKRGFFVDSLDRTVSEKEGNMTLGEVADSGSYEIGHVEIINDFLSLVGPQPREVYRLESIGLSQQEIGRVMGLSQTSVSRMQVYFYQSAERYGRGEDVGRKYQKLAKAKAWTRRTPVEMDKRMRNYVKTGEVA